MWNRLSELLSSLRIAVACLALLMILVVWGTLHQAENGLWAAQQRFFYSWWFEVYGWIRLPGAQLAMAVLFVNLLAAAVRRIPFTLAQTGLVLIHVGLLLLIAGGWFTHRFGREAFLALREGETSNVASSYREWEIALWEQDGRAREVVAVDAAVLPVGREFSLVDPDLHLRLERYHANARAFTAAPGESPPPVANASGIARIEAAPRETDREKDRPGVILDIAGPVADAGANAVRVLLFGNDEAPTRVKVGNREVFMMLRRKRYPLPLSVSLLDFRRTYHPNSEIPRSFASDIRVDIKGVTRNARVEMNHPFRYRDYTLYQSSFADLGGGEEMSTFAVTRNAGRVIPYVATGLIVLGLAIHFLKALFLRRAMPGSAA